MPTGVAVVNIYVAIPRGDLGRPQCLIVVFPDHTRAVQYECK